MSKHKPSSNPNTTASGASTVYPVKRRDLRDATRLLLFVRAGGRCEFDGCNDYTLEHHLTFRPGAYGEAAHIVAFKPDGPRGRDGDRPHDINDPANLMLLCARCHKLIDDNPGDHSRATLLQYKRAHEERIYHLTSLGPEGKTAVLAFQAPIGGHTVTIPFDHIVRATAPRYPSRREPFIIDLTGVADHGRTFLDTACDTIKERVDRFLGPNGEGRQAGHVSVFALGPIPLLIYLGHQLSNKVPCDVYQRHRDTETWAWKSAGTEVHYALRTLATAPGDRVALVLSLSGEIRLADLPDEARTTASIYEISLAEQTPRTTFLETRGDLERFRTAYQEMLALILKAHGAVASIALFPAVPAPVAVLCGRELLPKVHPRLRVYDYDRAHGGFTFQLEV